MITDVSFIKITDASQIDAKYIKEGTLADATAWLTANWDEIANDNNSDNTYYNFVFYVGTDLKYFWFQKYYGKDNAVGNAETNYENGNINTINQWYSDGDVIYICSDGNFSTTDPVSYMAWDEDSQTVKDVEGGCIGYF